MKENLEVVFGLLGGLALFLYGMNSMSDALQKAAGEKMKRILEVLTKNPVMGALAGALVTAVLQSSSATTVMVIGFVSAGLMSLPQGISVIFGANIGTTMTAQLMAFKISDYIYPIIFIGFMVSFLSKREKVTEIGKVIFSFGLLFEGIEIMGSVMKPLASSPVFIDLMGKVSDIPVLGVALGAAMTLVVQSSSATIAVLQNFASQPAAAMYLVSEEIKRSASYAKKTLQLLNELFSGKKAKAAEGRFAECSDNVKELQVCISNYISKMFASGNLTELQSEQTAGLLCVSNNIERIADRCDEIEQSYLLMKKHGNKLSEKAVEELRECMQLSTKLFEEAIAAVEEGDQNIVDKMTKDKNRIRKINRQFSKAHFGRVNKKQCDTALSTGYTEILQNIGRITDNCVGIAEEAMAEVSFITLNEEELKRMDFAPKTEAIAK